MSTRSLICCYRPEFDNIVGIYCHSDGYPEYVGMILYTFYNKQEDIMKLIGLGGLSSLGPRLGVKMDLSKSFFDSAYAEEYRNQCHAYHRDGGESFYVYRFKNEVDMFEKRPFDIDYLYYFKDGCWRVTKTTCFDKLENVLKTLVKNKTFHTYGIERGLVASERQKLKDAYSSVGWKADFEVEPPVPEEKYIIIADVSEWNFLDGKHIEAKTAEKALRALIKQVYGMEEKKFYNSYGIVPRKKYGISNITVKSLNTGVCEYFYIRNRK